MFYRQEKRRRAMADIKVHFLENDYVFPEELVIYVGYLKKFEPYYERAMEPLIHQMSEKKYSSGADVDFAYFRNPLKAIVEDVIKDLSSEGVFSVSVKELLDDNVGYQKLWKVCSDCFEKIKDIYVNATLNLAREYDNAYNSASSQITGLDYSILTNSASALLTYSILESNAINKQMKRADKEYRARITDLNRRHDNEVEQQEAALLVNVYYPQVAEAIGLFVDTLFNKYVASLANNGKYDLSKIASYDMEHSSNLLQNLSLIESKKNVIQQAFEACPYNAKVYISAVENGVIDENILKTASIFGLDKELVELLKEYCTLHKGNYDDVSNAVCALASYNNEDKREIYKTLYQNEISNSRNAYKSFLNIYDDKKERIKWVESNIAKTSSHFIQIADEQIEKNVSTSVLNSVVSCLIKKLIDNDILDKEDIFPCIIGEDSIDNCILNLISKVTACILEYKQEVICRVTEGSSKLEVLKKQYEEAKKSFHSKDRELDELITEIISQRDSLGFFAFSKKKELNQKLEQVRAEKESNAIKDEYIRKEQEYKTYAQQLEKLV